MSEPVPHTPDAVSRALIRAERLEYWTLGWLAVIVAVMGLAAGGSQAFRTAFIEDVLSMLAPALFLVSRRIERMEPREGFPYGFHRAGSLAFFFAAAALTSIGLFLLYEGVKTLVLVEHPSIGSIRVLEREIWMGWVMMAALVFSIIPPVIFGRKKRKVARTLCDKVLFTDADTNAADWQTGVAGILGLLGIALGLWWADAVMAIVISVSVLWDGIRGIRISTVSLIDGTPRKLDSLEIDDDALKVIRALEQRYRNVRVQIRETGRHFRVVIEPRDEPHMDESRIRALLNEHNWRLIEVSVAKRSPWPGPDGPGDPEA